MDQLTEWETALRRKVAVMRELGVIVEGGTTLGPAPPSKAEVEKQKSDPRHDKRAHYTDLLGRIPSNAELDQLP